MCRGNGEDEVVFCYKYVVDVCWWSIFFCDGGEDISFVSGGIGVEDVVCRVWIEFEVVIEEVVGFRIMLVVCGGYFVF